MTSPSVGPTLGRRKMPPWDRFSSKKAPQLKIYNSLTRRKDDFIPIDGNQVKFYICGPTVYDSAHMGHARAYLSFDIIRRVLTQYFNYDVNYVMNITDIDDKIIKRARQNFLFEQYQEKNKGDFYTVGRDVMKALEEFREKVEVETDPDKKKMLSEMLAKVSAVAMSIEKKLQEKSLPQSNMENETVDLLANAKDIISESLDKRLGSTVNDHSIFEKLAKKFENEFMQDMNLLNVMPPHILTRVSEYVPEIIEYVEKIINNEYAYVTSDGSVYFDSTKFQANPKHFYAKLVPEAFNDTENEAKHMKEGEGELSISADRMQEKKNNSDFALWKTSKPGEPFWESPWGKGRPGWHIECSAMSTAICGNKLDIHAGGFDLKFPHHDNEIAQCEAYFDDGHWVNYFLHCGTLRIAGSKMSKSLKNFISIRLAVEQYSARQIRILFLMHSWNDALDYSPQTMDHACYFEKVSKEFFLLVKDLIRKKKESDGNEASSFKKFDSEALQLFNKFNASKTIIHEAMCDSIDTRKVIETIRSILTESNTYITTTEATGTINADLLFTIAQYITRMLRIFGVIPEGNDIGYPNDASGGCENKEELLMPYLSALATFRENVRNMARTAKNSDILNECDVIRDDVLPKLGVRLEDRANQTTLKLEDPEVLEKERLEKVQKELEKKQQKENARLQAEANKKAKEEKKKQQELQKKKKQEEASQKKPPS
uniref:Cysteine--tRNA ligase n=1 Tax=Panagrolaimus sp. ES5 TaxID=591445 RepID=A0AC34GP63_9BILA